MFANRREFIRVAGAGVAAWGLAANGRGAPTAPSAAPRKPNFLLIVADDLGFSDVGCYGGEIKTPNLDRLAANGLRLTQAYSTGRCWPTRTSLLTGFYYQQNGIGMKRALLPELLKPLGYRSYHSGKWHVHVPGQPHTRGFDHSYYTHDANDHFAAKGHTEDGKRLPPADQRAGYYSTTAIADHTINYLKEHQAQHADQPFFSYMAFISPHFPIMAPQADIDRYQGRYDEGWDKVREERWQRLKAMGIVNCSLPALEPDLLPRGLKPQIMTTLGPGEIDHAAPWDTLTEEQKQFQARKMEIHAAMVDRIDREVGRVLDQVRAMGQLDNTVVIFLSDNGASSEMIVRGGGHDPSAPMGSARSFLCLGPGWSSASNSPFRRHKIWVHEGGAATPFIVHWPAGTPARGELRHAQAHVIDIVPTLLELAGGSWPETFGGERLAPLPGRTLVPALTRGEDVPRDYLFWEHAGNRALRVGNLKLVSASEEKNVWSLYDLSTDRGETTDLAPTQPEKVQRLSEQWERLMREFNSAGGAGKERKRKQTKPDVTPEKTGRTG